MNTTLQPFELSRLIARLNFEIQEQIINCVAATVGPDCVISWNKTGNEDSLEIRCDTKMIEVRSIVVPVDVVDSSTLSVALSGARLEVVGAWRIDSDHLWLRNHCFGDSGTLVLALASFEPEHIKAAATTLAQTISGYLAAQLEPC
jgi:hypothetical protein